MAVGGGGTYTAFFTRLESIAFCHYSYGPGTSWVCRPGHSEYFLVGKIVPSVHDRPDPFISPYSLPIMTRPL